METNKQRALYSTKLKTINTFPAVGGGISIWYVGRGVVCNARVG